MSRSLLKQNESIIENAREDASIWDTTVATLCLVMFVELYLVLSVMPYAAYMVIHYEPSLDDDTAGRYSGWVAASFMLGSVCMQLNWGRLADTIGRVTVLQVSLFLCGVFSLWFGCSQTFTEALFARFCTGLSCGLFGTIKTVVSEYQQLREREENGKNATNTPKKLVIANLDLKQSYATNAMKGYGSQSSSESNSDTEEDFDTDTEADTASQEQSKHKIATVMSFIVGIAPVAFLLSAISGIISDPFGQYSNWEKWYQNQQQEQEQQNGIEGILFVVARFLHQYPYFLPNFLGAALSFVALLLVTLFVPETLPSKQQSERRQDAIVTNTSLPWDMCTNMNHKDGYERLPNVVPLASATTATTISTSLRSMDRQDTTEDKDEPPTSTSFLSSLSLIWERPLARQCLLPIWSLSFAVSMMDESFSLFCISNTGGLGIREASIGQILSTAGVFVVVTQYHTYQFFLKSWGLQGSIRWATRLLPLASILMPFAVLLHHHFQPSAGSDMLGWVTFLYLSFLVAIVRTSSFLAMTSLSVVANQSVTPELRATMNGLSGLGGSLTRSLGPLTAGAVVSNAVHWSGPAAPWVIFVGVLALVQSSSAALTTLCLPVSFADSKEKKQIKGTSSNSATRTNV